MKLAGLNDAVGDFVQENFCGDNVIDTGVSKLSAYEKRATTPVETTLHQPIACLALQGSKEVFIDGDVTSLEPGMTIVVSHDMALDCRFVKASPYQPYRSLILGLDLSLLRSLYSELGNAGVSEICAEACAVDNADDAFVDALSRYFALHEKPAESSVMGPMILRELHFRLLTAQHGGMLRQLLNLDSSASKTSLSIAYIRKNYDRPIDVAFLARDVGMSASSFHDHFRSITQTTPLQYQKELRLTEARRLLAEQGLSVSETAFQVGYESPTQFSREYSRRFGASPRDHLRNGA